MHRCLSATSCALLVRLFGQEVDSLHSLDLCICLSTLSLQPCLRRLPCCLRAIPSLGRLSLSSLLPCECLVSVKLGLGLSLAEFPTSAVQCRSVKTHTQLDTE